MEATRHEHEDTSRTLATRRQQPDDPERKSSPPAPDHGESPDEPGYGHGV
jgi:hypothetical protein